MLHIVLGCCIQMNICVTSVNESWNMLGSNMFIHFPPDDIGNIPEAPNENQRYSGHSLCY